MKVIRIEHPYDGKGYWHSNDDKYGFRRRLYHSNDDEIVSRHNQSWVFPTYWEDYELKEKRENSDDERELSDYNFAYNSLEQLESGFTREEIKECIESLGFRVLMYTLEKDYFASEYQVIFIKESATNVEDISSLFL